MTHETSRTGRAGPGGRGNDGAGVAVRKSSAETFDSDMTESTARLPGHRGERGGSKDDAGREWLVAMASGERLRAIPGEPELDSTRRGWSSVHVEEHCIGALEIPAATPVNFVFAVHVEEPTDWEVADGGGYRHQTARAGQVSFFPAGVVFASRVRRGGRFFLVSLAPRLLLSHALLPGTGQVPRFLPRRGVDDPVARALCERIRAEATTDHPQGRGYVESLGQALAAHVLRDYTVLEPGNSEGAKRGSLTPHQLRRAMQCIRERLAGELSIPDMARAAGLSPFHFSRCFRSSTGMSPHQYLIRLRVEKAKELLERTKAAVGDIAMETGFCDPSHLSAHFRRWTGVSPRAYRDRLKG